MSRKLKMDQMTGKHHWKIDDLAMLSANDLFTLVDNIPSDTESVVSNNDSENEEIIENDDIEMDFETPHLEMENEINNIRDEDLDSDDDLPLATFLEPPGVPSAQNIRWEKSANNVVVQIPFLEASGPNIPCNKETPLDLFLTLFSEEILDKIVFETNLYATQKAGRNFQPPTTLEEIKCFIGLNILMGIKKLPSYKDYWSSRTDLRDQFIATSMSRNRFSWLLGHLHLNDNSLEPKKGQPGFDKLYKLRPMLDKLSENFAEFYKPSKCQSIDESMIRFKGRISFRQYMPLKPIKRGYKMWVRANESGFVSQFQIYTGKATDGTIEQNLGQRVVLDLTRALVGKHHEVYVDNFFNSVELQLHLQRDGIYMCGTVRQVRKGFPKDLQADKQMNRGDTDWRVSNSGLVAAKWKDNKAVHFLSNFHNPEENERIVRRQKDGSQKEFDSIKLVKDYNAHMGYVDKSDMYKACYEIDRKSKKWWHRIFWHFVDLTLVNAFLIFKERTGTTGKTLTLKEFRLAIANGLIGADPSVPQRGRRSTEKVVNKFKVHVPLERRLDKAAHMPVHGTKIRCANCSTRNEPHRTRWHCSSCNVGLCLQDKRNCFADFHKK